MAIKNNKLRLLFFLAVFLISFTVYILTLAPTVYLEDSGELIASAYSLGVAHPSGYPLYVILGKLFSLLPFGSVAYKVNLMSAFFGALTGAMLFLVIQRVLIFLGVQTQLSKFNQLVLYNLIPACSALVLNFGYTFWSQSVIAEVYTLNSFLLFLIVFLLLVWREKKTSVLKKLDSNSPSPEANLVGQPPFGQAQKVTKKNTNKYLLWVAFLFGLSLTNHQMMVLFLPTFLLFILIVDKKIILNYKLILAALGLFLLGLSLYAFILLRTRYGQPDFVWGNPYNWEKFKFHILRKQYNDFGQSSLKSLFNSDKLLYIHDIFKNFLAELTSLGLILSILGFIVSWFKDKKNWLLLTLIFFANSFFIIILRQAGYSISNDLIYQVYYLPAVSILVIFISLALFWLINWLFKIVSKSGPLIGGILSCVVLLFVLFIPLGYMLNNYPLNDRSSFYPADQYSRAVLNSLLPNAKLFIYTDQPAMDSVCFSLMYQQAVNNLRPDVKFINVTGVRGKFYEPVGDLFSGCGIIAMSENDRKTKFAELLFENNQENSPIYIFHSLGIGLEKELVTRSNGWVYRVYEDLDTAKQDEAYYRSLQLVDLPNLEDSNLINNLFYRDMISDYYYARAAFYQENGQKDKQADNLIKAIDFDASPLSSNYNLFVQHRSIWQGQTPNKEIKFVPQELLNQD